MKACSLDLRQRVLSAAPSGDRTIPEVAEHIRGWFKHCGYSLAREWKSL